MWGERRRTAVIGLFVAACLLVLPSLAGAEETVTVSVEDASATEGNRLTFVIKLSGTSAADVTVTATTSGGSGYTPREDTVTIPAGQPSAEFTVETAGDELDEPNRQLQVTLSAPTGAGLGDATADGTIVDDDATPTLAITGPASVDEVAGSHEYSIAITGKSKGTVSVTVATANGTATAGQDFGGVSVTRSWASGDETAKKVQVSILHDTLDENDETFTVNLSGANGATIATPTVTTTITDNDNEVAVKSISDVSVVEGNSPAKADALVTVELTAASGKTVTVPYATAPGTATEATDYDAASGSLVFAPGQTSRTITVKVNGDGLFEPNETFSVVLTDPTNGAPGPDMRSEVTITNDDGTPTPTVSSPSVNEGNSGLTDLVFNVSIPRPHPEVRFNYRTVAETADASDYTEVGGAQITFPANTGTGTTTLPITIKVKGDVLDENSETLKLQLLNPTTEAVLATATGTITNDDDNAKLSINDVSADEGTAGTGTMKFTVTLLPASGREVTVKWSTADGTASAGADYTAGSGDLTFAPGETSKEVAVTVLGDAVNEENETLKVTLSAATGVPAANVIDAEGLGTIVDKNAPPSLSISDATANEGQGATVTVTLSGTTNRTVTVRFNTVESSARAASDFLARVGTLTFAPGEKTKTLEITIVDDTAAESREDFTIVLGDAVNAAITKASGRITIEASDAITTQQQPTPVATPVGTKTPVKVLAPRMVLGPRNVLVGRNGIARMSVSCQRISPIVCAGTVELERSARPLLKLGKRAFAVAKGKNGVAPVKLSAKALAILRKQGTMRVRVIVVYKKSVGTGRSVPGVVTLTSAVPLAVRAKPKPTTAP